MDPITPISLTSPELTGRAAPRLEQPQPADLEAAKLRKLRKATSDFEALFLTHLLKPLEQSLAKSSGGENLGGDVMFSVAITKMAESLADQGGVGLGDMLYKSMEPRIRAEMNEAEAGQNSGEEGTPEAKVIPLRDPDAGPMPLPADSPPIPLTVGEGQQSSDKRD